MSAPRLMVRSSYWLLGVPFRVFFPGVLSIDISVGRLGPHPSAAQLLCFFEVRTVRLCVDRCDGEQHRSNLVD